MSLSEEEFHRLQLQIIEARTDNYKLRDDNHRQQKQLEQLTTQEAHLSKELNKVTKLKRALSLINKTKQAQEFESLLRETEAQFGLQYQTLKEELTKVSKEVLKLEKENKKLKISLSGENAETDETLARSIRAENTALKKQIQEYAQDLLQRPVATSSNLDGSNQADGSDSTLQHDPLLNTTAQQQQMNEEVVTTQALAIRVQVQLKELNDVKVKLDAAMMEKNMIERELQTRTEKWDEELKVTRSESDGYRNRVAVLEQNEESARQKDVETKLARERTDEDSARQRQQLGAEITSLGQALQTSQNLIDRYQSSEEARDSELELLRQEIKHISHERDVLVANVQEVDALKAKMASLQHENQKIRHMCEKASAERDDAVTKFEESARASGELLKEMDQADDRNKQSHQEVLREMEVTKQLAEKRKQLMDKMAIEVQENSAKFTSQAEKLRQDSEAKAAEVRGKYEAQLKELEHRCANHEQELTRVLQQDRSKTRELDTLQQQLRELQSRQESLSSEKDWFQRALKEAEQLAEEKLTEHNAGVEEIKRENSECLQSMQSTLASKDDEIKLAGEKLKESEEALARKDEDVKKLQQELKDGVDVQKLVQRKGLKTLKDLKRQLTNERKKNEKMQQKLREISTSEHSNLDELLKVVDQTTKGGNLDDEDGGGSSIGSSFRDFVSAVSTATTSNSQVVGSASAATSSSSPSQHNTIINKMESQELLDRITTLQQSKWALEERVRHLEDSGANMAQELIDKNKLMHHYVQNTRTDITMRRQRPAHEQLPTSTLGDRFKSMMGATVGKSSQDDNIRELNTKLTRMLEEEMIKNLQLKNDLMRALATEGTAPNEGQQQQ